MFNQELTRHASRRIQQRAIPVFILDLLERFGAEQRQGKSDHIFFDKCSVRRLKQHFGGSRGLRIIEPWLNIYVVMGDDGSVITVGHRR